MLAAWLVGAGVAVASGWVFNSMPNPRSNSDLNGVSCASPRACVAVGDRSVGFGMSASAYTVAERWDGSRWSIQLLPNASPPAANGFYPGSSLQSVSCTSSTTCVAVGRYKLSSGDSAPLVEVWDGHRWSIQGAPIPAGSTDLGLLDVSCASRRACVAVGSYSILPGPCAVCTLPLVEVWDGRSWSLQATATPKGAFDYSLGDVACTTRRWCMAVGRAYLTNQLVALAEEWDGTRWSIKRFPTPPGQASEIDAVSCSSRTACVAAVTTGNALLVQRFEWWDGRAWSPQTPAPGRFAVLVNDVSCASPHACTAVGSDFRTPNNTSESPLADGWDGARWSVQPISVPGLPYGGELDAVSCPSVTACIAVGGGVKTPGPTGDSLLFMGRWSAVGTPPGPPAVTR